MAIIKGGLGNQLFAYAGARAFALRAGRVLFLDDESGFQLDGYGRTFRLDRFPIQAEPAPASLRLGNPKTLRHRWLRSIDRFRKPSRRRYFAEKKTVVAADLLDFRSSRSVVYLNGYWQDPACFEDFAAEIRRELSPPELEAPLDRALEREIRSTESVLVHVRRIRYSPKLTANYYAAAISLATHGVDAPRFEVFGDDLAWAREHLDFGRHPARFHDDPGCDELRDFRLMSACRHAIVANSSFSWWAAWLEKRPGKKVWTPAEPGWPLKPAPGWATVPSPLES
ncbi:alpha-1,2-fucosyltransferase [Haloferula sargassicola]|uniref:alpha-1,2-fucosyltransferase n=1 Tax=Haloferula sargassicola TaxID=490096 RepID=UPI003365595A